MRRVVVTGVGLITPIAVGREETWRRLVAGDSGLNGIEGFDTSDLVAKVAGQVFNKSDDRPDGFDPTTVIHAKDVKKLARFIQFAVVAAEEAIQDSGWLAKSDTELERAGVLIGSGIGGLPEIEAASILVNKGAGPRRLSPFFIPSAIINLASGQVSIRHGLKGPNHSVVTACSTGVHAIGDAARIIAADDADVMVAGSAEAAVCRLGIAGFASSRALSTGYNDRPTEASRPYDEGRDGFVMGEGAGVVVLESLEHAQARGARIYGEVVGYGLSGDAYHITAPSEDGDGGYRSMAMAMRKAGLNPEDVDYINAHGTSTPKGDEVEIEATRRLFGPAFDRLTISSTKSAIGHLLGGAGSVEAIFCLLAIRDSVVPPTLNLNNPSPGLEQVDLAPLKAKERTVKVALSNSFGFGGTNATLIVRALD
jgi:3-oxoacyl-[acyl-carrier-protein] synthase II